MPTPERLAISFQLEPGLVELLEVRRERAERMAGKPVSLDEAAAQALIEHLQNCGAGGR